MKSVLRVKLSTAGLSFNKEKHGYTQSRQECPENKRQALVNICQAVTQRGREEGADHGDSAGQTDSRATIDATDTFRLEYHDVEKRASAAPQEIGYHDYQPYAESVHERQ